MLEVESDSCEEQGHSFEYMNYIPDFDHQCFVLEFQCEHCGLEVFDHIKQDTAKAEYSSSYTETMLRYWKRLDEVSTESYQLALKTPCVKGAWR